MTYSKSMNVHQKYLTRYMVQAEKELSQEELPSEVFGSDPIEYQNHIAGKHFKMIISPDNPDKCDFELLGNKFIEHMEKITGYKLLWKGVVHNDTDHKHMHLCINGRDKNGKSVYFPKGITSNACRETLSYLLTQMVGERTPEEIEAAKNNMYKSRRWTPLDENILELSSNGEIDVSFLQPLERKRFEFLAANKLCEKEGGMYRLNPEWKEILVNTGRYNTYLNEYLEPSDIPLQIYKGGKVSGTVEKVITFDREEAFNNAVIVNTGKERYYVPVYDFKNSKDIDKMYNKKIMIDKEAVGQYQNIGPKDYTVGKN